jgi:predicted nucleic acid-binding protein
LYLLDTNVVSELRRPRPHGAVVAWLAEIPDRQLFLSAFTIAELQAGVELTRQQDFGKAAELDAWIDRVVESFNILPMDAAIFRIWAKLMHGQSDTLMGDAMIAATAAAHGLTVVTRNVRDFVALRARVLDPFDQGSSK